MCVTLFLSIVDNFTKTVDNFTKTVDFNYVHFNIKNKLLNNSKNIHKKKFGYILRIHLVTLLYTIILEDNKLTLTTTIVTTSTIYYGKCLC
jgi:hypothetical protein